MIGVPEIKAILVEYVEECVPGLLKENYHLRLAKGGPDYPHLPEQSHFAHVVNGVFGLCRLLEVLSKQGARLEWLDAEMLRKALAAYTIHDLHKEPSVSREDDSMFSIPLTELRQEYQTLALHNFVEIDTHLMRAANVHRRSPRHGDLLLSEENEATRLWLLVRLADAMASAQTPTDAREGMQTYLRELSPVFAPTAPPGRYALYYHKIGDVRGVLTRLIHQAAANVLNAACGLQPVLYFVTGTLYMGPARLDARDRETLIDDVVGGIMGTLEQYGEEAAHMGLIRTRYNFQDFAYVFANTGKMLAIAKDLATAASGDVIEDDVDKLLDRLPDDWDTRQKVGEHLALDWNQSEAFMDHWYRVRYYLLYVDHIVKELVPGDALEWLFDHYPIPRAAAENLSEVVSIWGRGGYGKYVMPLAYHFLKGPHFSERPPEALPPETVIEKLHEYTLRQLQKVDLSAAKRRLVGELGFDHELREYLHAQLYFSFDAETALQRGALEAYERAKRKGHSKFLCSLCNRQTAHGEQVMTGILDDFGRVFSNRVLPAQEAPNKNRTWCPLCHLEFMLRKLAGLGLPEGADYGNSRRIYLYVLPTFSFTPNHGMLFDRLVEPFKNVTELLIRDYGADMPGTPRRWLSHRALDPYWYEDVLDALAKQADWIAERGGRGYVGERIHMEPLEDQPPYYLLKWEKAARSSGTDEQIATRTEAWCKALLASLVVASLTSCKVYVSERPYLAFSDPSTLRSTIMLDGPPPAVRALMGSESEEGVSLYGRERGGISGLEHSLDLSAALWFITKNLQPGKDKDIAGRLNLVNVEALAGATFYKEYARENDGRMPERVFVTACEIWLEEQGGLLMDLVERIAEKSLAIGLPFRGTGRGKAHRFERVFREAMDALRKGFQVIPALRRVTLTGDVPDEESIRELKRLASGSLLKAMERRMRRGRSELFVRARGKELNRLTGEIVDILVDDVYLRRARGSFARFLQLENSIADGVYYYIDQHLGDAWDAHREEEEVADTTVS